MKNKLLIALLVFALMLLGAGILLSGCSKDENDDDNGDGDDFVITIVQPAEGDTIIGTLLIRAECEPTPDYVEFYADTFSFVVDSISPYQAEYDISLYPSGEFQASAIAYWEDIYREDEVQVYIEHIECDSTAPVVLNGDTIPEWRITRDTTGCVIEIDLSEMSISDPNCLSGIELYPTLQVLDLGDNNLTSIDLSPLSSCTNLLNLKLDNNNLTSIDLAPLASCTNLQRLYLYNNQLTSIDLAPISSCTNLQKLYLGGNDLTSIDLSPLSSCTNLQGLYLSCNNLTSIDLLPLSSCTNLKGFDLWDNNLTSIDLSPLTSCTYLQWFSLCANSLTNIDLSPLEACANLEGFSLSYNDLTSIDLSPLSSCTNLLNLKLDN
ncbi:hypothetical protein DRQ33_07685, partial [bacterium]